MPTGAVMPRKKISDEAGGKPKPPEKFSEGVKFRPTFKEKLELVARDEGLYPGELVEREMEQYVETNYVRVLRKRLKAAEGG